MDEDWYTESPQPPRAAPREEHTEREVRDIAIRRPTSEERTLALLCHIGLFIMAIFLALIVWLLKKESSRFVDEHGREAVNYQLTRLVVGLPIALLMLAGMILGISNRIAVVVALALALGVLLSLVLLVMDIVFCIRAAIAAHNGESYRYPLCIRFF